MKRTHPATILSHFAVLRGSSLAALGTKGAPARARCYLQNHHASASHKKSPRTHIFAKKVPFSLPIYTPFRPPANTFFCLTANFSRHSPTLFRPFRPIEYVSQNPYQLCRIQPHLAKFSADQSLFTNRK